MGGILSVVHDIDDTILEAYIFTPGQGICLQKLSSVGKTNFCFDEHLCYGSWYDILFVVHRVVTTEEKQEEEIYMKTGLYLTYEKKIKLSAKTKSKYRLHHDGREWTCYGCSKANPGHINMCRFCLRNQVTVILDKYASVPIFNVPVSFSKTVLEWGRAVTTGDHDDFASALTSTVTTVVNIQEAVALVLQLQGTFDKVIIETGVKVVLKMASDGPGKAAVTMAWEAVNDSQAINLLIKEADILFAATPSLAARKPSDMATVTVRGKSVLPSTSFIAEKKKDLKKNSQTGIRHDLDGKKEEKLRKDSVTSNTVKKQIPWR